MSSQTQNHKCEYVEDIQEIGRMVKQVHECLLGTLKEPGNGLCNRVEALEDWRKSQTTRYKSRFALFNSAIGGLLVWVLSILAGPIKRMLGVN